MQLSPGSAVEVGDGGCASLSCSMFIELCTLFFLTVWARLFSLRVASSAAVERGRSNTGERWLKRKDKSQTQQTRES